MKVRFKVNVGKADAEANGLTVDKCLAGAELEVPNSAGEALAAAGHVEILSVAKPAEIKGVPPQPTVKAKTKADDAKVSK